MQSTITAIRHSFGQAFVNSGRSIAAHSAKASTAIQTTTTKATAKVPTAVVATGQAFGQGVLANMVALEIADLLTGKYIDRRRRQDLNALVAKIADKGASDADKEMLELLSRAPERRTFGQFVRDIPSRTMRRVWRATLVEAGWWYGFLTLPIYLPVVTVFTVYTWLFALPYSVLSEQFFGHKVDHEALMAKPMAWTKSVLHHTLFRGVRVFMRGVEMRLYDGTMYMAPEGFDTLDAARFAAHDTVKTIVDGRSAFVWGEALAEAVAKISDPRTKQQAFAQSYYWAELRIAPEFINAVMHGFRAGTPMLYRDYVTV